MSFRLVTVGLSHQALVFCGQAPASMPWSLSSSLLLSQQALTLFLAEHLYFTFISSLASISFQADRRLTLSAAWGSSASKNFVEEGSHVIPLSAQPSELPPPSFDRCLG